jgi:aspartate 1-decarboxylase
MAGWGDDPELEKLRGLLDDGWSVTEIQSDPDAAGGPSDTVKLTKDGETQECTSDHLAFHRYVEGLQEELDSWAGLAGDNDMQRVMMKSKIHRATVTDANLNYIGSITIDRSLMEAADLLEHEQVHVVNIDNGARFETYVIEGEPDSGTICLNGAAARLVQPGDKVIVISYALYERAEYTEPKVVQVDDHNRSTVHLHAWSDEGGSAFLLDVL